jgi:hypothetical protein
MGGSQCKKTRTGKTTFIKSENCPTIQKEKSLIHFDLPDAYYNGKSQVFLTWQLRIIHMENGKSL